MIAEWSEKFKLEFNASKTKLMMCTRKRKRIYQPILQFKGSEIQYVDEMNILGVIVDSKLKFYSHVQIISNKLRQLIFAVTRIARRTWAANPEIYEDYIYQ